MNVLLDILIVVFIVLGVLAGIKRGLIKSIVSIVGLIAIIIISYALRIPLANFLIDKLPFFSFGGSLAGLTSLNILIYNLVAFIVLFIVLYCVLNIVLALTGFIDTLLKFTVIWIIPSKIGGGIIGFIESWLFVYLALFVLIQLNFSTVWVSKSTLANVVLDHTPLIGSFLGGAKNAAINIYESIENSVNDPNVDTKALNLQILNTEISYQIISKEKANELIQTGKLGIEDVLIGKGINKWLDI